MTVLTRRRVDEVAENHGVDLSQEEQEGRLVQHVEGTSLHTYVIE